MIGDAVVGWLVTALLGGVGCAHLVGALRSTAPLVRADALLHSLMCVAMAVMVWPWGVLAPMWPQVVVFGGAGAWYTAQALVIVARGDLPLRVAAVPSAHAAGMFAMVWMLVGMAAHEHGHATPAPVSFTAALLGLVMVVLAGWWVAKAWPLLRAAPHRRHGWTPLAHAAVHGVMAGMVLIMR
ncbi:MAG: DUF5134 domain-containing protein [Saccharothrix sp.]|nr:DUF5134 domain-containing protein [Saccharothrix sp.]